MTLMDEKGGMWMRKKRFPSHLAFFSPPTFAVGLVTCKRVYRRSLIDSISLIDSEQKSSRLDCYRHPFDRT